MSRCLNVVLLAGVFLPIALLPVRATSLNLGAEYRIRGNTISNPDFDTSTNDRRGFYSHRMRLYLNSQVAPSVELGTKLQAIGVVGSTTSTVTDRLVNPAGSRYPNTEFTPWIEHAYLAFRTPFNWPMSLTVGRQPIKVGDGLLLSDDDLGLTGIRAQAWLPLSWDVGMEAFTF
ncbi:MAG: putative porin, partial [Elusimicrobia bacterium]|nr:putative porin [Elusimicrobiota bacterium]